MIIDKISNCHLYDGLGERFAKGFEYLRNTDFSTLEPGKYVLDGDNLKVAIQEYETRSESDCKVEAHKRYADIQYIFSGEEKMGIDVLENQQSIAGYNEGKDVWHFDHYDYTIRVKSGMFTIFFPEDIHMPCLESDEKQLVKKVVVKVLL
ncbi:YhcH/YjgK/YiaL family protein [Marinoscillum sp. MHG1-6]|uniref:YhcH/YjgK/YiaL family protein n=1 Tax=Marinoscillum sp. MHG1-6 TaxID=2959627 RepID=UPI002157F86A|nr:YhcH/YjgK/YiaL family protein [Marinoscillum sp. MHG1-6]